MKNTLFFPGLGETQDDYKQYSDTFDVAHIDWNTGNTTSYNAYSNIVSFSLGCVFSLEAALENSIESLILCSPTPFESLGEYKAKKIYFVIGEKEQFLIDIFTPLLKDPNVTLFLVPDGDHNYNDEYHKIVTQILKKSH